LWNGRMSLPPIRDSFISGAIAIPFPFLYNRAPSVTGLASTRRSRSQVDATPGQFRAVFSCRRSR
jgi:hypothetical protein